MKGINKFIVTKVLLATLLGVIVLLPEVSLAQGWFQLAGCSGPDCQLCHMVNIGNGIIKWLIGVLFVIFAVIMAVAGFGLVTSGGNPAAKQAAKNRFINAIVGFIIVLAAWLIIDTLMRTLLDGGTGETNRGSVSGFLYWSEVQCLDIRPVTNAITPELYLNVYKDDIDYPTLPTWYGDPTVDSSSQAPLGTMPSGCSGGDCVALAIPCKLATSCSVAPALKSKIEMMHNQASVSGARVTEAMMPTRAHKSPCHNNGTCVDYSKAGGMTSAEVVRVINASQANGLRPVYEVVSQAQKDELIRAGAPAGSIQVLGSWISAPHFSIYGY